MKKLLMCVLGVGFFFGSVSDMYGKEGICSELKTQEECSDTGKRGIKPGACVWENNKCKRIDLGTSKSESSEAEKPDKNPR